jgi:excinuclease UvrABC nuclease subunit
MVKKIVDIQTVKVDTEMDALILENNLIKSLTPKYTISKTFTGTMLMQLAEAGKIDLDTPVKNYLPKFNRSFRPRNAAR